MPSLIMKKGNATLQNIRDDGLSKDSMEAGHFCFSCEQIFANRRCLEEHVCSSVGFICSCGTEFTEYKDMQEHSTTHEPGHQVLDHETIRKRRIERRKEEEEKLKRLKKGEVVWKAPDASSVPSVLHPVKPDQQVPSTSSCISPVPLQPTEIPQLNEMHPSLSKGHLLSNPLPALPEMQNIFAGVGAPTVDLWTIYQPVVLLQKIHNLSKKAYVCGKCGQEFMSKASLVFHHSSHVTAKISGCIGCGLLLSGKKFVPRFHDCKSQNNQTKQRLITAKPPGYKPPSGAHALQNLISLPPQATSTLQLQNQNPSRGSQAPHIISTLKTHNIRTYNNRGLHATPSFQSKSKIVIASRGSLLFKKQVPTVFSQGLRATPSALLKRPTNSASAVLSKPMKASTVNVFACRVCHLPFETPQLLQRHKCARAQEFMAKHMASGRRHYKLKRVTPVQTPNSAQMNSERKLGFSPGSTNNELMAVSLEKGKGVVPVNGTVSEDVDDDCYIVEGKSDNPAEMIYKVTSSVPIKT